MSSVSVIIPARNAAPWIAHAVRSVTAQTAAVDEIIVIDNASADNTCNVVEALSTYLPSLTLLRNHRDLGPAASRNRGIGHAKGDWIALLDADDWYAEDRIAKLVALGGETSADIVADNQFITTDSGLEPLALLPERMIGPRRWHREIVDLQAFLRCDRVSRIGNLGLIKPMFRSSFLKRNNIHYDETAGLTIGEDALFYICCLMTGAKIHLTAEPLYYYRQHGGSLSRGATADSLRVSRDRNMAALSTLLPTAPIALARAIEERERDFENMIAYKEFTAALRGRNFAQALHFLAANPRPSAFILARAIRAFHSRIPNSRWYRPAHAGRLAFPRMGRAETPIIP